MKVANGIVNDEHVAAVLKMGSNWEVILASGQRFTISEADAKQLVGEEKDEPKPSVPTTESDRKLGS